MPKGKSKKKGSRRSRASRAGPANGPGVPSAVLGVGTLLGIPTTQKRELAYAGSFAVTSTAGAYSESVIPLNDAFSAFGGASATGYAKYMAFYSKCFVLGARCRIRGVLVPGGTGAAIIGVAISSASSSFASAAAAIEAGLCQWEVVGINPDRVRFDTTIDVRKFLNLPSILSSSQLYSTSAASPSVVVDAHVFVDGIGSFTGTLSLAFETIFECVFTDPIPFT